MRAYVITSGSIFGLIVVAHILRAIAEGFSHVARDPFFMAFTVIAAALTAWAVRVLQSPTGRV